MSFYTNFLYNFMFESLKLHDVSHIKQYIVDRRNNKTFDTINSYLNYHKKPLKPFYYKSGTGPNAIYSSAYINIFNKERQKINKDFYIAGSSGASIISTLIKCRKKDLKLDEWFQTLKRDNIPFYEWFTLFRDTYLLKYYTIDDFDFDELFINVLCYDFISNTFKVVFFTNFKDIHDLYNCIEASCFIPKITNKKKIHFLDNYIALDAGFIDGLFNYDYTITNSDYTENNFLKNCFNYFYSPYKYDFSKQIISVITSGPNKSSIFYVPFKDLFYKSIEIIENM